MKKKRNTTSKVSSFFGNFLFASVCIAGSVLSVYKFSLSFNQSLTKLNEQPIATITFKYNTAQRKFEDRVIWDRLKQDSPVYNGDIIRTAPLSEATIWFTDGNIMELYESTMAQVYLNESGVSTDLSDGSVGLNSENASSGITLNSGNNTLKIESGAKANATQAETLKVQVQEGSAELSSADGAATQKIESGNLLVVDSSGKTEKVISATVNFPAANEKILFHDSTKYTVNFSWQNQNFDENTKVLLEIATNKSFKNVVFSEKYSNTTTAEVPLENGTYYYRLMPVLSANSTQVDDSIIETVLVSEGKFQLMHAPSPDLLVPAENYEYTYRSKKPAVRFIWSENEYATSWELKIADNPRMQNPLVTQRTSSPSSIISELGHGTYYWQVTPYYSINSIGLEGPSEVSSFVITQSGKLNEPTLYLPTKNGYIDNTTTDGVSFSWKNETEAIEYALVISNDKNLQNPLVKKTTTDNYTLIDPKTENLTDGIWYWAVTQTDVEGNVSDLSEIRSFISAAGTLYQRTVFPPDNYSIADGRLEDTKFTWKTNIPFATKYQVSKDASFNNIVIDELANLSSIKINQLPVGDYYWRIKADTDEIDYSTLPKKFTIMPQLAYPKAKTPEAYGRAVIYKGVPFEFTWDTVPGADYYKLTVYNTDSSEDILVYEENFIESSNCFVDMQALPNGNYRWTIQAFAEETEFSTRRTGVIGSYPFTLKHLIPVKLGEPANNSVFDGIEAYKNPGIATWSSVDEVESSVFYLSKNKNPKNSPIFTVENPKTQVNLIPLQEGTYYWTLTATSVDDLDITAEEIKSFTVKPIPPLLNAVASAPKNSELFNIDYFRKNTKISFNWEPVPDAEIYKVKLIAPDGSVCFEIETKEHSFEITDLTILGKGQYTWQIEAENYYQNKVFQKSGTTISNFTIDLPSVKKPTLQINEVLYGK